MLTPDQTSPTGPQDGRLRAALQARSVQAYIDETPLWADGTKAPSTPMTSMQWRIWWLATAGKFFEGLVVFMTGVALPLLVDQYGLTEMQKGMVSSAPLFGILVGASALGGCADRFGRKRMFIVEMILFVVCLASLVASQDVPWLVMSLLGVGAALGCDYPTAHLILSESIPSNDRGRLVLSAFGFQAVGALCGTAVGYLILIHIAGLDAWRYMYATAIIPAILVTIGRFFIPDSAHWLASRGRVPEAEREMMRLLHRKPPYPHHIRIDKTALEAAKPLRARQSGYKSLFSKKNRRATILASVPWFLQDLSTYGIGIFTPTILATVVGTSQGTAHNVADIIARDILATKGAAFLDLLLLFGIVCAFFLVDRIGRIRLQIGGFIGCAAGLALAAASLQVEGTMQTVLLFSGFMLFNFMTNAGPNAMTYLLAGEVFPCHIRGKGAGLAASLAKVGAVATAFLFPILLADIGTSWLLAGLTFTSLLGAVITWFFSIETKGVNLERLD
ncbi:MFS transporter [Solidesulfovibrio sp.]